MATMKRKELARYLIGPSYAFGKFGCPPRIPPNATSKFYLAFHNYNEHDFFVVVVVVVCVSTFLQLCLR